MRLRYSRFLILTLFAVALNAIAQDQPPASPSTNPPAALAPPAPAPRQTSQPDYPERRTFTIGAFYWFTAPGSGPDIRSGKLALGNESLLGLGADHRTPGIEVSFPITRTGELHLEAFRSQGSGNQISPADTTLFGTSFNKGDSLLTNYKTTNVKFYLEDLFFPHKFPVAKFRVRSLWEVQYIDLNTSIDALNGSASSVTGSRNVILPSFGLSAEYVLAPHVLFRAAGSGFGIPHRSVVWDAEATISVRKARIEFVGGAKAFHFKSSPAKEEYVLQELYGGFVGLRYHFGS